MAADYCYDTVHGSPTESNGSSLASSASSSSTSNNSLFVNEDCSINRQIPSNGTNGISGIHGCYEDDHFIKQEPEEGEGEPMSNDFYVSPLED